MRATAALTANAEHDFLAGNTQQAVRQLIRARSLALAIGG
jgi:predicted Zn-dependent protease